MDDLYALAGRQGKNAQRYAGIPGTGPAGTTCKRCAHLRYTGSAKRFPKCGKTKYTHGDATTIRTSSPSCSLYEADDAARGAGA
jgi:hypothetical protein